MLIDWFTFGAQVINFFILVWLMKRFLYKPILDAIDAREARIAHSLAEAAATQTAAEAARDDLQKKNDGFDRERTGLFAKATAEAKAERERLIDAAREAADTFSTKSRESLANEARDLNQTVARRTQDEVFAITRQVLTDLADTELETRACAVFLARLSALDDAARSRFAEALKSTAEPVRLRSAFDLPTDQRSKIQDALNQTFSADIPLQFETAPELVGGIELNTSGQKVAWSITHYLDALEKDVVELLKGQTKP
jgi:F-type H+-transporting ATPase subunit b